MPPRRVRRVADPNTASVMLPRMAGSLVVSDVFKSAESSTQATCDIAGPAVLRRRLCVLCACHAAIRCGAPGSSWGLASAWLVHHLFWVALCARPFGVATLPCPRDFSVPVLAEGW